MRDPIDHAREQYRAAKLELKQREWDLSFQIVAKAQELLGEQEKTLRDIANLIKEVPGQPSLDHASVKQDVMTELEAMATKLKAMKNRIARLQEVVE